MIVKFWSLSNHKNNNVCNLKSSCSFYQWRRAVSIFFFFLAWEAIGKQIVRSQDCFTKRMRKLIKLGILYYRHRLMQKQFISKTKNIIHHHLVLQFLGNSNLNWIPSSSDQNNSSSTTQKNHHPFTKVFIRTSNGGLTKNWKRSS